MTDQERQNCEKVAVYLNRISGLGLVVFITFSLTIYSLNDTSQNTNLFQTLFTASGFAVIWKSCHLHFDAQLFQKLASGKMNLKAIDELILKLFNKKIQNKTLEDRITGSYQLTRVFFVFLIIHLVCFGVAFWVCKIGF
jgi:S-adenosylmethionine:tRNA-ribosyltransferase-isomerase (queuine synthetase)